MIASSQDGSLLRLAPLTIPSAPTPAQEELLGRSNRLLAQRVALEKLLTTKSVPNLSLEKVLPPITEIVSQALEVERVSVWRLDNERQCFVCLNLVENGAHSSGIEFSINSVPEYFRSMVREGIVAASDACEDTRTVEFRASYLEPQNITSMLDTLIYVRGNIFGILCVETCHQKREWEEDERSFALAVSNVISLCIEQSEHEQANKKVKEAHDRLQIVLEATHDAIWDLDLQTNKHWLSSNFATTFGHPGEVFENGLDSWIGNIHGEDRARVVESFYEKVAAGTPTWTSEYRFKRGDGSYATVLDRAVFTLDEKGRVIRATGSVSDISELRKSEARFRLATLATHELIWERNIQTDQVWWSDSLLAHNWFSDDLPEKTFEGCFARVHPDDQQKVKDTICQAIEKKERFWSAEHRILLDKGGVATVLNRAYIEYLDGNQPMRMIGAIQDITEKKTLEAKFLRAQRLESIGTLASGVAHDLNNVLAPILMGTQLLESIITGPDTASILENMRKSAERGGEIVRQLLTFARGAEGEKQPLQVIMLFRDMVKIIRQTFPKNINATFHAADDLWMVEANLTQIHQVLLNLCVNARDAMPHGGHLALSAANCLVDSSMLALHPEACPGPYVKLTISDTGTGMTSEVLANIFSPFFTTKGLHKGTGLGLSTVLGIVKGHKGFVEVKSQVNKGSEFAVYLPAVICKEKRGAEQTPGIAAVGKGETILVVDDDEAVRETITLILRGHGYRVFTATDGVEALAMLKQRVAKVDLILTDLMMPIIDGFTLTRAVREFMPDVAIIVLSGVCEVELPEQNRKSNELASLKVNAQLKKPLGQAELLTAVASTLHRQGQGGKILSYSV